VQVRKIKRRACEYDYVEVMACPGGCLNGGGQSAAAPGQSPSQLLDRLDAVYHDPEVFPAHAAALHASPPCLFWRCWVPQCITSCFCRAMRLTLKANLSECELACGQVTPRLPEDNPVVAALYNSMAAGEVGSDAARALFFTQYHKREKTVSAAIGDW
jgi:hypothetical protein